MLYRLIVLVLAAFSCPTGIGLASDKAIPEAFLAKMASDLERIQNVTKTASDGITLQNAMGALRVTAKEADLKSGASIDATTIRKLTLGEELPIITRVGGWFAIGTKDGTTGWISAKDFVPIPATKSTAEIVESYKSGKSWLGTMQSGIQPQSETAVEPSDSNWTDWAILELLKRAAAFKETYRNNEYVSVTGFDINISVPPSLGMSFEFK